MAPEESQGDEGEIKDNVGIAVVEESSHHPMFEGSNFAAPGTMREKIAGFL